MATVSAPVSVMLDEGDDLEEWKNWARRLIADDIPPERVIWQGPDSDPDLWSAPFAPSVSAIAPLSVPRAFATLASAVILHSHPERWALLYRLLYLLQSDRTIIGDHSHPTVRRLNDMARQVRRDIHKMRAFVRFRELDDRYVAWFEPDHHIVRANAAFFVNRFSAMQWSILTPEKSIHWDGAILREGPGAQKHDAPASDPVEDIWKSYYASIFNPARLKVGAMVKEMPRRYWKNMPEAALIGDLVASAQARERTMVSRPILAPQRGVTLDALRREAANCTRCPLHRCATRTVFGEGPADAGLMVVGEQPGDTEDRVGRLFVGPAGRILDRAFEDAALDRSKVYLSNAVKHFKFRQSGQKRLHQSPNAAEISMCKWWIDQERDLIKPRVILMLGATAAQSLLGRKVTIAEARKQTFDIAGAIGLVTVHPSYILRLVDPGKAALEYENFVADCERANRLAEDMAPVLSP